MVFSHRPRVLLCCSVKCIHSLLTLLCIAQGECPAVFKTPGTPLKFPFISLQSCRLNYMRHFHFTPRAFFCFIGFTSTFSPFHCFTFTCPHLFLCCFVASPPLLCLAECPAASHSSRHFTYFCLHFCFYT